MTDPRLFALTRDANDLTRIVGYGLVLPDGSAYSISWPTTNGASFYATSSAEECADLRAADLMWIGDEP